MGVQGGEDRGADEEGGRVSSVPRLLGGEDGEELDCDKSEGVAYAMADGWRRRSVMTSRIRILSEFDDDLIQCNVVHNPPSVNEE